MLPYVTLRIYSCVILNAIYMYIYTLVHNIYPDRYIIQLEMPTLEKFHCRKWSVNSKIGIVIRIPRGTDCFVTDGRVEDSYATDGYVP